MGESLYEQIKSAEEILADDDNLTNGDDHAQDDGERIQPEQPRRRSVRGQDRSIDGQGTGEGDGAGDGAGGRRGSRKNASRSESGASFDDARTSQRTARASQEDGGEAQASGGGTQEDARTSQEDGENVLEAKPLTNREAAALRIKNRALEAELAKLKATPSIPTPPSAPVIPPAAAEKPAVDPASKEPDKNVNYQEWLEWKLAQADNTASETQKLLKSLNDWKSGTETQTAEQQKWNQDAEAFMKIEADFTRKNPDYGNAAVYARDTYFKSIKMAMPQASDKQINDAINNEIMAYARQWAAAGLNPAQEFYDMAIERFGYESGKFAPEVENEAESQVPAQRRVTERPNLKVVSSNRKKSATPLSGGGQGGSVPLSKHAAALDMSVGEFSKLTPDELAALEEM